MFRKLAAAAALLFLASSRLFALGLGEIEMQSALNQPMQAIIGLTSAPDSELADIKVSLASLQAHQRAGLSRSAVLASFRFSVEKGKSGGAVVRVTSTEPVREPFLEFMLELEWPKGRLLRQYTVLVDPPVTMPGTPAAPQVPVTPAARAQPARQPASPVPISSGAPAMSAPAQAAGDEYGPIRRSDTLWSIAERLRPGQDVSTEQVMQALLRANPQAFIDNNINQMKAGVTLKIPGRDEMLSMSAREAYVESIRQYNEWKTAKTVTSTPEPESTAEPEVAGTADAAPAAEKATPRETVATESRLSLVAPEGDSVAGEAVPGEATDTELQPGSVADLNMQLALAAEEAEAGRSQSRELQSRVEELERQIETMKRLLELKDHALTQLQDNAASKAEQARLSDAEAVETETAGSESPTEGERPADIMGRLMDNPLLAGAGVLVAILLGGFLWAANRQKNHGGMFDEDLTLDRRIAREAPGGQAVTQPVHVSEHTWTDEPESPPPSGEHDVLAEADVYLAYGRIQQAEDVLQAALQDDPGNDACQLKLLEVYHAAGNVAAFEQTAREYRDSVTADDGRWLKVAEMGRALAPNNGLFREGADEGAEFDMDLSGMDHLSDADAIEFDMDHVDEEDAQEGMLASEDEISTKLDLARAYIDMDDMESARSILGEVIKEGSTGQKQEAEKIISQLA